MGIILEEDILTLAKQSHYRFFLNRAEAIKQHYIHTVLQCRAGLEEEGRMEKNSHQFQRYMSHHSLTPSGNTIVMKIYAMTPSTIVDE